MFRKNSLFLRILTPVTIIMLLQALLISWVLFANGTVQSLEDSAVEGLQKNVGNRGLTLENTMVHSWSNLDKLESDVTTAILHYLKAHSLNIEEVLGNREHESAILNTMSESLISALRLSLSTGVYVYFTNIADVDSNRDVYCNGLYYRDLDPVSTPADYSDILYLRGIVGIARKDNIQLDSLWNESFAFSPANTSSWRGFSKPLRAALNHPGLSAADLSYWNTPHYFSLNADNDSSERISYSRPIMINGRPVAMIGTEMQVEQLLKYYPANDFGTSGQGGYLLLTYNRADESADSIPCQVYAATGSYIRRMLGDETNITLERNEKFNAYTLAGSYEDVKIVLRPLRLYNNNAPSSDEQWALASIGTDNMLFGSAQSVTRGVVFSTIIAFFAGIILLAFVIRLTTHPLIGLASQIEKNNPNDPIVLSSTRVYEIELLCSTINEMKSKRQTIEMELREERERYLMALESAADTFVEYDVAQDAFMLYYFAGETQNPELSSQVIRTFSAKIGDGEVCPREDIPILTAFLNGETHVEARIRVGLFLHVTDTEPDGDYYWFSFKASHIYDDAGGLRKIIGTARQITQEKLRELALFEAGRRDQTTGFFNLDYGARLVSASIREALASQLPFALCMIRVDHFDRFEAHYGRVFSAAVLMELSAEILRLTSARDIAVRVSNDECMLFFSNAGKKEAEERLDRICRALTGVYAGESPDLTLSISAGIAMTYDSAEYEHLAERAYKALQYSVKTGGNRWTDYTQMPSDAQNEAVAYRGKPVSVSLNLSKEEIVGFVFDIFERTNDVQSVINLLLCILGRTFSLHQAVVAAYDADFGSNKITNQWNSPMSSPCNDSVIKISLDEFACFDRMLDANGSLLYDGESADQSQPGIRQLLCLRPGESCSALCCATYENGVHAGRMIFKSADPNKSWSPEEIYSLHEITKIVSAHISIEKSNTASKAKSEFLSRMSHEIRTPMNAIIGMTKIARESIDNQERLTGSLSKIDFSAKHLLSLINDVLDMSRIESGKMQLKNEPFSLLTFAETLDTLMRPQIESKNITFTILQQTEHTQVIGDEYRLRQVLVNLLGNAGKFTGAGGTITLSLDEVQEPGTEDDGRGLFRFSVKDTGIGISKEDQPLIFSAFEQAHSSAAALVQREGTGLGLSISSSIISAMGGRIELISEMGAGSEFFFTLRMERAADAEHTETTVGERTDYKKFFEGKRVLLVEDNEINIEIALYALETVGFVATTARNGREAVDQFTASGHGYFDVIVMDIQMPVMNGLDAAREIRKNSSRPDARTVPIIAMTANAFDEDMKKSIESGMNGHLAKPIDSEKLYALLEQLLRQAEDTHGSSKTGGNHL